MAYVYGKGAEIIGASLEQLGFHRISGFPHPPIGDLLEYLSKRDLFLPAASVKEMANVSLGLALGGKRACMVTSGSNLQDTLEALSYASSYEVPITLIHVGRSIPGFGNPYPYQGDLDTLTNGDFPPIVFAPSSLEEIPSLLTRMVSLSEKYLVSAVLYVDSALFHMTGNAAVELTGTPSQEWGLGIAGRRFYTSLFLDVADMKKKIEGLAEKYAKIGEEGLSEAYMVDDAEYAFCAYGVCAYVARKAADELRLAGVRAGLVRPVTLYPFPHVQSKAGHLKKVIVAEMSNGQLYRRIRLQLPGVALDSYITSGGLLPEKGLLVERIKGSI
jgi:2-oxoglutarate ferredoxin oxidoreductase subunit alpha